jgi:MoxR-like ATPase
VRNPAAHAQHMRVQARLYSRQLNRVAEKFVDREEAVRVLGLAMLCREHVLLIGPPGTAKTAIVGVFEQMFSGMKQFSYLLTRFTEPAELFGPLDVKLFNTKSIFRYNTTDMLPMAHIAFLDEVFAGSSAILNTLLTLINERMFYNGPEKQTAALHTLLGSTNTLPTDPLLAAFGDRFMLRCTLKYVGPDRVEKLLERGWEREEQSGRPAAVDPNLTRFPLADLEELQREVTAIGVSGVRPLLAKVLRTLGAQGVQFSDRRVVKAQKLIAASALLAGRREAVREDLGVLAYLWTQDGDDKTIREILSQADVPSEVNPHTRRESSTLVLELRELTDGTRGDTEAERRDLVEQLHLLRQEAEDDHSGDAALLDEINQAYTAALAALTNEEREGAVGYV